MGRLFPDRGLTGSRVVRTRRELKSEGSGMRLIPRVVLPVVATMMAITALALIPSGSALAYPGADNLSIQQQCQSPNNVQIGLFWTTYNLGEQWVDVSLNNNNFAPGTFLSNGPVAANVDHVVGSGIQTGVT